jgi:hypothetical protein
MSNGWRDGLLATWIICLIGAVGMYIGAVLVLNKGQGDMFATTANLPTVSVMAGAGTLLLFGWFFALLTWLAVSAIVREHYRDRDRVAREH